MAKLRALRLARDAELAASRPAAPPTGRATKGGGKKKAAAQPAAEPAGTLADWMKDREESGHNN